MEKLPFKSGEQALEVNEPTRSQKRAIYQHLIALHLNRTPENTGKLFDLVARVSGLDLEAMALPIPEENRVIDELAAFYVEGMDTKKKPA